MVMDPYSAFLGGRAAGTGSEAVNFLEGTAPDSRGRMLEDVLAYSDAELERRHDFIQRLFPLTEASRAVPGSPVLSADDVAAIRRSPRAQQSLRTAAARMEAFYADNDRWLTGVDHNHLRITRIIKSLRLLVDDEAADRFRQSIGERVVRAGNPVNAVTLRFWAEA